MAGGRSGLGLVFLCLLLSVTTLWLDRRTIGWIVGAEKEETVVNIDAGTGQAATREPFPRLPSLEERLEYYLGAWNNPSIEPLSYRTLNETHAEISDRWIVATNDILVDSIVQANDTLIRACARNESNWLHFYCQDVEERLLNVRERLGLPSHLPILIQFGDGTYSHAHDGLPPLPHFRKFRTLEQQPYPILVPLNTDRHYGLLPHVNRNDVPYASKNNQSIFWGGPNGPSSPLTGKEHCLALPRCRLVYNMAHSKLVVAQLVRTRGMFPDVLDGRTLVGGRIELKDYLQYKGIIIVEGNDVASGLKWALYSQSVVLMAAPTKVSFVLEDWLQPWVHYIPLQEDWSDVEEQTQWMLDHEDESLAMAQRGRQWIEHMWFHNQTELQDAVLQRYAAQFGVTKSRHRAERHW